MLDSQKGAEYLAIATPADLATDAAEVELRIVRTDNIFIAFWRENEDAEWREAGEFESDFPDTVQAGVMASNTARNATAEFAYIRLLPGVDRQAP